MNQRLENIQQAYRTLTEKSQALSKPASERMPGEIPEPRLIIFLIQRL